MEPFTIGMLLDILERGVPVITQLISGLRNRNQSEPVTMEMVDAILILPPSEPIPVVEQPIAEPEPEPGPEETPTDDDPMPKVDE